MAYVQIGRMVEDELIPILQARMRLSLAKGYMDRLRGLWWRYEDGHVSKPGDLWVEVADHRHDLIIDPVMFPPHLACAVLVHLLDVPLHLARTVTARNYAPEMRRVIQESLAAYLAGRPAPTFSIELDGTALAHGIGLRLREQRGTTDAE